jgi:hypothetical protein
VAVEFDRLQSEIEHHLRLSRELGEQSAEWVELRQEMRAEACTRWDTRVQDNKVKAERAERCNLLRQERRRLLAKQYKGILDCDSSGLIEARLREIEERLRNEGWGENDERDAAFLDSILRRS